jgi:hypothetical protein
MHRVDPAGLGQRRNDWHEDESVTYSNSDAEDMLDAALEPMN